MPHWVSTIHGTDLHPGVWLRHLAAITNLCFCNGEGSITSVSEDGAIKLHQLTRDESDIHHSKDLSWDNGIICLCYAFDGEKLARGCEAGRGVVPRCGCVNRPRFERVRHVF